MGDDDVICIDSDDDDEDEATRSRGSALVARAPAPTPQKGPRPGGGYWRQRRRAQRGKWKHDYIGPGTVSPLVPLLEGLRRLSSELYRGDVPAGRRSPELPPATVGQRIRTLVADFQRHGTEGRLTIPERDDGWRQVVRFLVLFRTVGLPDRLPVTDGDDPGRDKDQPRVDDSRTIDDVGHVAANQQRSTGSPSRYDDNGEKVRQTRRYQLTVIDILADYIRFRCETVVGLHPPIRPVALLRECNRIVSSLFVIFAGCREPVMLTLLRVVPERRHALLLYPVFENVLTCASDVTRDTVAPTIRCYVRALLCFKRWKSLVGGRMAKGCIDGHAIQLLPDRCPALRHGSDLPFLRLLAPVPPGRRANETRYLLVTDLFDLERTIGQYFRHHRRMLETVGKPPDDSSIVRQRRLLSMEMRSNYINVPLMAELIERKSQLWAFPVRPPDTGPGYRTVSRSPTDRCLQEVEVHSIVESLRMIFRNRTDFIELTLLHVAIAPMLVRHSPLLGPLFDAFLRPMDTVKGPNPTTDRLTIYRSNDVETYGRLVLCYAKWKALYWTDGADEPCEWPGIDAVALAQLPTEFPRSICPRDARLRSIFTPVLRAGVRAQTDCGQRQRHQTTTRILLRTLPKRDDLQELCREFIQSYHGCGAIGTSATRDQTEDGASFPTTIPGAYKSMSSAGPQDRPERWHVLSGLPTFRAHDTERRAIMEPIIIPDSTVADEMSACDTIGRECDRNNAAPTVVHGHQLRDGLPATGPGSNDQSAPVELDRVSPNAASDLVTTVDVGIHPLPVWPPLVECFLNTPPATPQQDVGPDAGDEEHRRSVASKKSPPTAAGSMRLKGMFRTIGRRKKCISKAGLVKRVFADGEWWNFADIRAVKIRAVLADGGRCASIMKPVTVPSGPHVAGNHRASGTKLTDDHHQQPSSDHPMTMVVGDDRTANDALLRELIDGLGAVDTMPSDATQGYVDFAILADNPGYGAERSQPGTVGDQASPSVPGTCIDTSPLFAAASDRHVLLFTELGPVPWPIV